MHLSIVTALKMLLIKFKINIICAVSNVLYIYKIWVVKKGKFIGWTKKAVWGKN